MKCSISSQSSRVETILAFLVAAVCALAVLAWPRVASAQQLAISPSTATVAPRGTQTFTASGGSGAGYAWSMAAAPSGGQISSNGDYTAGPTPNVTDQVQVTDSMLNVATATVVVSAGVTIMPPGITLAPGNMQQFTAAGGTPPYSWSLVMNTSGGNISAAGLYTAGNTIGSDTVRVADSANNFLTVPVTVVAKVPLGTACTSAGTCPVGSDGNPNCVDGVCCSSACTAQCQACNTANSLGTCVTISGPAVGMRTACPMSDPSNVCTAKVCDGKNPNSCDVFVGSSTICGAATCIDLVGTPQAVCQGDGTCQKVTQQTCAPFACISDQCATSCTNDSECTPGNYCDVTSGKCIVSAGGGSGSGGGSGASASGSPKASSGCSIEERSSPFGPFEALLLGLVIAAARARARLRA
jgi:hypothetical protein